MKILLISPYHGGSHQAWAEGWQQTSRHEIDILSLPARFWKWRMHGGAVTLARRYLAQPWQPDLILATDMLDLTTFLALTRPLTHHIPTALYMHENQLTYPLPGSKKDGPMRRQHGERDYHYVFINYASALAADTLFFNSSYHRTAFLEALPRFLKHFPEYNELNSIKVIEQKSRVLPVGVNLSRLDSAEPTPVNHPPLILWNQRWEYDKNPEAFFRVLRRIQKMGIPFQLALCGQRYGKQPDVFARAEGHFANELVHVGFADDGRYRQLLWQADITLSTAHHEFFGISIIEAAYCQTFPLLPNRLSYPEIIPQAFHPHCLYQHEEELVNKLAYALTHAQETAVTAQKLSAALKKYDWSQTAPQYDEAMTAVIQSKQKTISASPGK